ncbi:flavin reductase family protein [Novosphingobium resinovorum]|uniref:flavin reductase family protein n=1 Tax=Novosphingobium resinovorum TaxID=158500 RepID=UPI002ED42D42|nr:flavin reductase family protein [Novosphingobium resinovorum]
MKDAPLGISGICENPFAETAGISPATLRQAFRNHPGGVAVITADDGTGPVGLTATSVTSVSAEPPFVCFSLSSVSPTSQVIANADSVVIHLLGTDQLAIAKLFSTKGADRFGDVNSWARLPTGEPYLVNAPIWIRGQVVERLRMKVGASVIIACHVLQVHNSANVGDAGLVYHDGAWHALGAHSKLPA